MIKDASADTPSDDNGDDESPLMAARSERPPSVRGRVLYNSTPEVKEKAPAQRSSKARTLTGESVRARD